MLWGLFSPEPLLGSLRHLDKYQHVIAFATVSLLGGSLIPARRRLVYWLLWLLLAILLEYMQGILLPHRRFDSYDVLANLAGVCVGGLLCWVSTVWSRRQGGEAIGGDKVGI